MPSEPRAADHRAPRVHAGVIGSRLALAALAWSGATLADLKLVPFGSAQYEYNSNIFALSGDQQASSQSTGTTTGGGLLDIIGLPGQPPPPAAAGDSRRSDSLQRYVVGLDTGYSWSEQKLHALAEARRLDYAHFDRLDHNEYLVDAGLDWRWSVVDGILDYRQERRMASFADRRSSQLAIERERIGTGSVNLDFNPEWRLENVLRSRRLETPLPGFPGFSIRENSINSAVKYIQVDTLAAGVYGEYLSGRFAGVPDARSYRQESLGLTADYTISGLSRAGAQLGYTRRQDEGGGGTLSGFTGLLAYHRELTGKTSAGVQVFRRVSSYVGGAGAVKDTGAEAEFAWQTTEKISLAGAYQFTRSRFQDSSAGSNRTDETQLASLKSTYQALTWLALRPYAGYQSRDSTVDIYSYHATIVGVELLARFDAPK